MTPEPKPMTDEQWLFALELAAKNYQHLEHKLFKTEIDLMLLQRKIKRESEYWSKGTLENQTDAA